MKLPFLLSAALFGTLLASPVAWSEDDPTNSRFSIMVGGFWPDVDTTARADGDGGRVGTSIDFESDLGLDDRDALFTGGLSFRLAKRHYFDLLYFKLARNGVKTIDLEIDWKDQHFERQANIDSFFDTEVLRLSYGYAFVDNDRHRLLGQFGVHYTRVSAGLQPQTTQVQGVSVEADTDVPLPVFGLDYTFAITDKLLLNARAQLFRLEFEGIDGALDNLSLNLNYSFTPRIGAFIGYNYYSIDVDADADHWKGSFDFNYYGPWIGVVVGLGEAP